MIRSNTTKPRYNMNTDHWSKMRMNIIKNSINNQQRGRVITWEKHNKLDARYELEAAIRNARNLPQYDVGMVYNFEDILKNEFNDNITGRRNFSRQTNGFLGVLYEQKKQITHNHRPLMTGSRYTLMTLPTNPQSDQTRSRVPVLQCRGRI